MIADVSLRLLYFDTLRRGHPTAALRPARPIYEYVHVA
jgi:hypothetical protein